MLSDLTQSYKSPDGQVWDSSIGGPAETAIDTSGTAPITDASQLPGQQPIEDVAPIDNGG